MSATLVAYWSREILMFVCLQNEAKQCDTTIVLKLVVLHYCLASFWRQTNTKTSLDSVVLLSGLQVCGPCISRSDKAHAVTEQEVEL